MAQEPVAERYQEGVTTRHGRGRFGRLAVALEEIGDVHAGRQLDQPLFQAQEEVIDLGGFALGLLLADFAQRKGLLLALESKKTRLLPPRS